MALNKYMHPRNIYKVPPDFKKLAKLYPEFSNIAKKDINGKVSIDFKDPHSLRVLTKCLLHYDFNLNIEIPEDRLVPTLPLRLNYILWVEDLMTVMGRSNIKGIDIGTGACAIYPLLGAVKNKWQMIGTESDEFSTETAQKNIYDNNLQDIIKIKQNFGSTLLEHLFVDDAETYDFCVCNPPFYSNVQELFESRSNARPPPKNGFTGSPQELITEGGELEFIRKLIAESKILKENIHVFTTMVGHKYNIKVLLEYLKVEGIKNTHTEFCQGRITRWGLAWTFKDYPIGNLTTLKKKKPSTSIVLILSQLTHFSYDLENVVRKVTEILKSLNINIKVITKRGFCVTMDILAQTNTWSNQRRKKRHLKRIEEQEAKKTKTPTNNDVNNRIEVINGDTNKCKSDYNSNNTEIEGNIRGHFQPEEKVQKEVTSNNVIIEIAADSSKEPVVHAISKIIRKGDHFVLELEYLNGSGGKEGIHQIIQYIKNNWK